MRRWKESMTPHENREESLRRSLLKVAVHVLLLLKVTTSLFLLMLDQGNPPKSLHPLLFRFKTLHYIDLRFLFLKNHQNEINFREEFHLPNVVRAVTIDWP